MAKKEVAPTGAPLPDMTEDEISNAIAKAAQQEPHLAMLRDKLIKAIEGTDGGMEMLVRAIRAKLHEG